MLDKLLNKIPLFRAKKSEAPPPPVASPIIVPRSEHNVSRANISENALKVLYRLVQAGYEAYLVGGGVRDMLLGREPKDFDVATSASPEEVRQLFRNCVLIGRRFRLAHVRFGREVIEVATFRAETSGDEGDHLQEENGRILRDNVYGTLETDAWRRDFTVNALYYNIKDFSVVDYTGGMADLKSGVLRLIGDPERRYREDPVRMLRAVRFAAKLGFRLHPDTEDPLWKLGSLLEEISPARLFDETLKLFMSGHGIQTFEIARRYKLFGYLYPQTEASLAQEEQGFPHTLLIRALTNTDTRIRDDKPVTPAFLYAALLWEPYREAYNERMAAGDSEQDAAFAAGDAVVAKQLVSTTLPKRFSIPMREIWAMQSRFEKRTGKRPLQLLGHPRFRAAYDFLLLRAEAGEEIQELCDWWTEFQQLDETGRLQRLTQGGGEGKKRRRRKRRRRDGGSSGEGGKEQHDVQALG